MPDRGNLQLIISLPRHTKTGHVLKWRFVVRFEVFINSGTSLVVTTTTGDNLAYLVIYYTLYIAIGSIHLCVMQSGHSKKSYKTGEIVIIVSLRNLAGLSIESQFILS